MHNTHKTGAYWSNINGLEERENCATCNTTESMSHILTECREQTTQQIWDLAQNTWPYPNIPWPEPNLGIILGCGSINPESRNDQRNNQQRNRRKTLPGPTRLLQIILSESAYLTWVLRCERVIQEKTLHESEIKGRWLRVINERLTINKITATKTKRNNGFTNLIVNTWEQILEKERELPPNWINQSEVLVGRTT